MARTNNHGYGYGGNVSSASSKVHLPEKVPCGRCEKKKGHHCYSKNRLNDLRAHIYKTARFDAAKTPFVNCMMCSGAGAQQLELDCNECEKTLPNTRFNKTQRRNPDHAICMDCAQTRVEQEPNPHSSDDDDSGHDGSSQGSDEGDEDDDTSTMTGTFSGMSMTGSSSYGGVSLNGSSSVGGGNGYYSATTSRAPSVSGSGFDGASVTSDATNRSGYTTTSSVLPPGFNTSKYGTSPHLRAQAGGSTAVGGGGGKWAKVRAGDAISRRPTGRTETKAQTSQTSGAHEDDDIGVASDESDSD